MAEGEIGHQVAGWAWRNRKLISEKLTNLFEWFREKGSDERHRLLIIGPGGAGKTTLARILSGNYDWLLDTNHFYEESIGIESYNLDDDLQTEIIVPPGQRHRRDSTWEDLQSSLSTGVMTGIILVGNYGYCNLGDFDYKDHRLYENGKKKFLQNYLAENRRDEIRILEQMIPYIKTCPERIWLMTVVVKQDLWWHSRQTVEAHYRDGDYGKLLQDLVQQCDRRRFRAETVCCCLSIRNFGSNRQDILQKNCAGYGQPEQARSLHRLFEVVGALRNWETES